jgi:MFS family permease
VVLLAAFAWHEVHTEEPVIDLQLVVRNPFLAENAYNFIYGACVFGFFSFIPYYAVVQFGMGPAESGEILTPRSILMICMSTVASLFLIRRGYRWPMIGGMFFVVGSLFLLSRGITDLTIGSLHVNTFWLLAAEVGLAGIGMGLAAPSSNNAALDLLPGRAAVITGVRGMFRSTGGVLGIAVIVLCLEFSPDKAAGLRTIFLVLSGLLLVTLPITFAIPDTARGRHERQTAARPVAQESTASS